MNKCFHLFKRTPCRLRTDCGTENVNIVAIQKFFRENDSDEYAGEKSFIAGSSTSNQVGLIVTDT